MQNTPPKHLLPVYEQKEIVELANKQLEVFWLPDEIDVSKDIQDIKVNLTESERHGVITTLKLFSLYETNAGDEYWGTRFKSIFDGAEFHRLASVFSMFELAIHAPFYNKINELLHLDEPEFYLSYLQNDVLKSRIEHIGEIINNKDDLVSLAMFSMVEGVILYSSFAFLKHFDSRGKHKLVNLNRGINFSVRDENFHSVAGAWCFRYLLNKKKSTMKPQEFEHYYNELLDTIIKGAKHIYEHEDKIVDMVFEKGEIENITKEELKIFVKSRINKCFEQLDLNVRPYHITDNPIAQWFYKGISDFTFNDFFSGIGKEYVRDWDEDKFEYVTSEEFEAQELAKFEARTTTLSTVA